MKVAFCALFIAIGTQLPAAETNDFGPQIHRLEESIGQLDAKLARQINEVAWFQRLSDVAVMDKVQFTGPPPKGTNNLPSPAGSNDVIVSALTFFPKAI